MKSFLLFLIRIYRQAVSPWLPPACRFVPSCSAYCADAIAARGVRRGALLGMKRLLRCHPFSKGGIDFVREA